MSEENVEVVEAKEEVTEVKEEVGVVELKEELEVQEAEAEVLDGKRKVNLPTLGDVIISFPSIEVDRETKRIYSEEATRLMDEGKLKPLRAVEKQMRLNGSWLDEDDEELDKISKEWQSAILKIEQLKIQLDKADKKSKVIIEEKIATLERERLKIQRRLAYLSMTKENLLSTSIEEAASRVSLRYKLYRCTSKPDGTKLFSTFEEMLNYNNSMDLDRLTGHCINFWAGIQDPLLESLLEEMTGN